MFTWNEVVNLAGGSKSVGGRSKLKVVKLKV